MKTKLFLAAVAVAFSFALSSCGNKPASTEVSSETVEVETVETAAPCCKADSAACDSTKACCKDKACCEKKADCKKECDKK
ncbi:hypothetical protein [Bacteroides sp.]